MDISQIIKIDSGKLFYSENGTEKYVDLKKSSYIWYDRSHKDTIIDKISGRRKKNIYAGVKCFCTDGTAYIKLYDDNCEYCFEMNVCADNLAEMSKQWGRDKLPYKQGYWLFDWS